jgi:hypothetical protein
MFAEFAMKDPVRKLGFNAVRERGQRLSAGFWTDKTRRVFEN